MFEALAHKFLRRGGKFNVRPQNSDTIEIKDVPPMQLRLFSNLTEVDVTKIDTYYRPASKRLAAVDALASEMLFHFDFCLFIGSYGQKNRCATLGSALVTGGALR